MDKDKYIIRAGKPEEAEIFTEIAKKSKGYWGYPQEWIKLWKNDLKVTEDMVKNGVCLVVEKDDQIKGFWCRSLATTKPSPGHLFLEPSEIGKGCGRILWNAMIEKLKEKGIKEFTFEADPNAVPFYEKMGASKVGEIESDIIPGRKLPILRFFVNR